MTRQRIISFTLFLLSVPLAPRCAAASIYTFEPVVLCPGCGSLVSGINNSGGIAGSVYDSAGGHAFYSRMGALTTFDQTGAFFTEAIGITDLGRVTVNFFTPSGTGRAYVLETDGSKTFLPIVEGARYVLGGNLNESGVAVGFYGNSLDGTGGVRAFVVSGTTLDYTFAYPGALITQALGVNNAGVIVGAYLNAPDQLPHGFIRNIDGLLTPVDIPGSLGTSIYDINNVGELAGSYVDSSGRQHGFVYRDGSFISLDFPGPDTTVFGINDLGQAVGASYPAGGLFTGPYSGFIATPVPEPSSVHFVFFGAVIIAATRSRVFRRQISAPKWCTQGSRQEVQDVQEVY